MSENRGISSLEISLLKGHRDHPVTDRVLEDKGRVKGSSLDQIRSRSGWSEVGRGE